MMKVLVTGANGQLGMSLKAITQDHASYDFLYTDVEEMDICNYEETEKIILDFQPDVLVNCASYNAVDQAEEEQEPAIRINARAVQHLAGLARKHAFGLIHISTDYIFDGKKGSAYTELDDPNPQSKYAHSKYIGEQAVHTAGPNAAIIRTSWLYSEYAHNFVKTIRKLARDKEEIRVINDQMGTPTYAGDLAKFIMHLVPKVNDFGSVETYNYSNEGLTHWAGFAEAVISISGFDCKVIPVSTAEYRQSKAKRPAYSLLDKAKAKASYNIDIPYWEESLRTCISNLNKANNNNE